MNMNLVVEGVVRENDRHLIVVALEKDMKGDVDQSEYGIWLKGVTVFVLRGSTLLLGIQFLYLG